MNLAAISPDRMGDVLFSLPVIAKIQAVTGSSITLFIEPLSCPLISLLSACPVIADVQLLNSQPSRGKMQRVADRVLSIRTFDAIVSFAHNRPTHSARDFRKQNRHMIDYCLHRVLADLRLNLTLTKPERVLPLNVQGVQNHVDGRYAALACTSRDGKRNWGMENWQWLIERLPLPSIALGGPNEPCPANARSLLGKTTTLDYARIVRDAAILISVETFGTSVLAECVGTPIVKIINGPNFSWCSVSIGPGNNWDGWTCLVDSKSVDKYRVLDAAIEVLSKPRPTLLRNPHARTN